MESFRPQRREEGTTAKSLRRSRRRVRHNAVCTVFSVYTAFTCWVAYLGIKRGVYCYSTVCTSSILNGISFVVRSFVGVRPFFLYCTTVQFCCTCAVDKKRKSGPRAQKGSRATGTTWGTHPRAPQVREQRGTVLRTKLTAPEPHIARAPKLVQIHFHFHYVLYYYRYYQGYLQTLDTTVVHQSSVLSVVL